MTSHHESNESMDHLSHPLRRQCPTTHHHPYFHRRPRPSALRTPRRLPGRERRRPAHPAPPDLRGHLCPVGSRRISLAGNEGSPCFPVPAPRQRGADLPTAVCKRKDGAGPLALNWPLTPDHRPLLLWKTNPHPRTKPVIAEDTTCCVYLLTGTISGSNFAIPEYLLKPASRERGGLHATGQFNQNLREVARPEVTRRSPVNLTK